MSRIPITCTACQKPLLNGTDTFGDVGCPFCWQCYSELCGGGGAESGPIYGLGPHHHDVTITGSIIGSTVFDPLPAPDANGDYVIGNRIFTPDPDAPGLGVWESRPIPGWR